MSDIRGTQNMRISNQAGARKAGPVLDREDRAHDSESEATLLQKELDNSDERLSLVVQAARLGTWDWNLRLNELAWSARCLELFGLPADTAMSYDAFLRAIHPEDRQDVEGRVLTAIRCHTDYEAEMRTIWPDGSLHWVASRGRAYYDEAGRPERMVGVAVDITERMRAEEALRESEAKFRSLFDSSLDAVLLTFPDGRITAANPAACAMFGMTEEEFRQAGRSGITEDPRLEVALENRQRLKKFRTELTYVRKDRTKFEGEMSSVLLEGNPVRSFVVIRDITERKRAEEELRLTTDRFKLSLRGSPIVVFNQDLDLRYTWIYCPDVDCDTTDFIGKRDTDLFQRPGDAEASQSIKAEVIRTGTRQRREVLLFWRGMERRYDLLVDPLLDTDGKIAGVTCAAIDITERKRAQEALVRSEKLASLGRMAATIAHEINNPLEGVMNLLYLANSTQDLPPLTRQYLEMASEELNRVAHITRQSLGFYRESGTPALTSVKSALESAVNLLRSKIREKRAVIHRQYDDDVQVIAVAGEIRQVFANLLSNSLDAISDRGIITLRVSTCHTLRDGQRHVRVTIADNGMGIGSDEQKRIFEALFTTKGTIGTGLGLWVSKQIIDKHGGTIRVRSKTEDNCRGTVFSILLPIGSVAAERCQSAVA